MNIIKKIYPIIVVIVLALILTLTSFNLVSVDDMKTKGQEDKLVGVVITDSKVELKSSLNQEGEVDMTGVEKERNGVNYLDFSFDNFGSLYLVIDLNDSSKNASLRGESTLINIKAKAASGDKVQAFIEGDFLVDKEFPMQVRANPVYQTSNNEFYALKGDILNTSLSDNFIVLNQNTRINNKDYNFNFKINFNVRNIAQNVTVTELDENMRSIEVKSYSAEDLPKNFTTSEGTKYLIIDQRGQNQDGIQAMSQTLDRANDHFNYYTKIGNHYIENYINISWN